MSFNWKVIEWHSWWLRHQFYHNGYVMTYYPRYQTDNCFNLSCWLLFHHSKNTFSPSTQLKSYIYWEKWYRTIIPHKQSRSRILVYNLIYDMIIPSKPFVTNIYIKKNNQGAIQIQLKWKFLQFVNLNSLRK